MKNVGQTGFTLVEVLVSIFVLALGVIGTAGMQLTALRTTQQSAFQTSAIGLATEMADKMRVNANQMKLADAQNPFLAVNYQSASDPDPTPPGKLCYTSGVDCSAAELAGFDIYEWEKHVKASLPGGRVLVCRDASPWDSGARAFTWNCNAGVAGAPLIVKVGWQAKNPDGSLIKDAGNTFAPSVALPVESYAK